MEITEQPKPASMNLVAPNQQEYIQLMGIVNTLALVFSLVAIGNALDRRGVLREGAGEALGDFRGCSGNTGHPTRLRS